MADPSKQGFLNSLFQWTIKNTAGDPSPTPPAGEPATAPVEPLGPMTEDKKAWLNDALENVVVNPIQRLKVCIEKLKDPKTSDEDRKEFTDELCHWSEELDLAKDFFTMGGLDVLHLLLDHADEDLRLKGCSLIATLVQNHPDCQRIVVQSSLQEKLLKIMAENQNDDVRTKALTAISSLIRGYTLGQLQLQKLNGIKTLVNAIPLPIPRLQMKLAFLINTLCSTSQQMKKHFYENGALDELIRLYIAKTSSDNEHVLEAILSLADAKRDVFPSLHKREPQLVQELEQELDKRLDQIKDLVDEHNSDDTARIYQLKLFLAPPSPEKQQQNTTSSTSASSLGKAIVPTT